MRLRQLKKKNLGGYQIPDIPCTKSVYKSKYCGDKNKNGVFSDSWPDGELVWALEELDSPATHQERGSGFHAVSLLKIQRHLPQPVYFGTNAVPLALIKMWLCICLSPY